MFKRLGWIAVLLAVLLVMVAPAAAQDEVSTVCLVTDLGRINDGTFNEFAYEGMLAGAEEGGLDTTYIETQQQTDYATNIDTCIKENYDVIVTVGFLLADATMEAAKANPDTYFIGVDHFVADGPENYVGIQFREDQSAFLVGSLAALVSESGTIGGVYGIDVPPVVRFRNGYEQGIKFMGQLLEKEFTILGVYIPSFTDPAAGGAAAAQFIGEGADVLFGGGGPTGSGAIVAGAQAGVWVIGVDQDEYFSTFGGGSAEGSDKIISSGIKRVDVGVHDMVLALAEGRMDDFPGGSNYVLDISNGGMTFAGPNDAEIPEEYYTFVKTIETALGDGTLETGVNPGTTEVDVTVEDIIKNMKFEPDLSILKME
ncbi:MAG: BMP family ABC transporter substrate-binding protein [Anaerolineae bacterium]